METKIKQLYTLNGFGFKNKFLYKYMCYKYFVDSVENKELVFVSPTKWDDPFEYRFLRTDYSDSGFTNPTIACMCFTPNSNINEDACWKIYGKPTDITIRISFDFKAMCETLDDYGKNNNCKIYLGKVKYMTKKEIRSLHINNGNSFKTYFPKPFSPEHYLSLMCVKRDSFKFENEVRIFIVGENENNTLKMNLKDGLLKIPDVDYNKLVKRIMFAPNKSLPKNNKDSLQKKKECIKNLIEECTIQQSQLYSKCERVHRMSWGGS